MLLLQTTNILTFKISEVLLILTVKLNYYDELTTFDESTNIVIFDIFIGGGGGGPYSKRPNIPWTIWFYGPDAVNKILQFELFGSVKG